ASRTRRNSHPWTSSAPRLGCNMTCAKLHGIDSGHGARPAASRIVASLAIAFSLGITGACYDLTPIPPPEGDASCTPDPTMPDACATEAPDAGDTDVDTDAGVDTDADTDAGVDTDASTDGEPDLDAQVDGGPGEEP